MRGAALSKKSAHGGAAQRAASGSNGWKLSEEGSGLRLNLSPRMGVCEPLSTVHGRCQSHGTGGFAFLGLLSL